MPLHKRMISYNGKEQCISDWAKELGINKVTLASRLYAGWTAEKALTTPIDKIKSSCAVYKSAKATPEASPSFPLFTSNGRKVAGIVWADMLADIEDDKYYGISKLGKITSVTTGARAVQKGEITVSSEPGKLPKVKGSDIKAWVKFRGFRIVERPTTPKPRKESPVTPPPFKEYKITESSPLVEKYVCFNRPVVYGVCCLFGLLAGFVLSRCI